MAPCWQYGVKIGFMSALTNYGLFFSGYSTRCESQRGSGLRCNEPKGPPPDTSHSILGDARTDTNTKRAHKPAHASELALAVTQNAHIHTHGSQEEVTQGASSFSQAGYLQRLVLRQPGETSPGLRQCLGGA